MSEESIEAELRALKAPNPKTQKELIKEIRGLLKRQHDYGSCVYAVSLSSVATFNYVANNLGITGFQAERAKLDILKRLRGMRDGFRILNYANLLYPQYCNEEHFPAWRTLITKNLGRLKERANELLKEKREWPVHPNVERHWKWIISLNPKREGVNNDEDSTYYEFPDSLDEKGLKRLRKKRGRLERAE